MTIVVTGGGSGGHITPLIAVAEEIKKISPDTQVVYVGERHSKYAQVIAESKAIDASFTVRAGKFRRYHGAGLRQLLDVKTVLLNIRDMGYVVIGFFQALRVLKKIKPDAVFVKGGFVGVPVGLAASRLQIPFITHDSDALPGLANRIVSRWATEHAVGMPVEFYRYPKDHTHFVGIPLTKEFTEGKVTKVSARQKLDIPSGATVVFFTGGGLGAQRLNDAVLALAGKLLDDKKMYLLHQVGARNEITIAAKYEQAHVDVSRVRIGGYITNMWDYYAAADIVVTRAGATNMAECAALSKPTILVPNPFLTGGHQLKNAEHLLALNAVKVVEETHLLDENESGLSATIFDLLAHPEEQKKLAETFHSLSKNDAATQLAALLLQAAKKK
jgi:UDP-N-acetylglucosamine--N-acetylmuramyl-(pentapeptide) pyrophosphoryl-undecaprenol N-acetylglucosamine transferase